MLNLKIKSIIVEDGLWRKRISQAIEEEGYNVIVAEFKPKEFDKDKSCHIYTSSEVVSKAIKSETDWEKVDISNFLDCLRDCFWARSGGVNDVFGKIGNISIWYSNMIVA